MAKLYNLARMSTATIGTGTVTLGSAVPGALSFAGAGISNGETVTYAIQDGSNSEIGRGVYTSSGTTLTRSVIKSTNSNTAISLSGAAEVFITPAAEDFLLPPVHAAGRLTLTTAVPVTTADLAGQTTIYYTPAVGDTISIYDAAQLLFIPRTFTEMSLALSSDSGHTGYHQSGKNFDLFVINDSGTLRLVSGPAWSSDTARGTGAGTTELELKNGIWTNKVALANARFGSSSGNTVAVAANCATYVGSFRATANGQATDGAADRLLYNAYNQTRRPLFVAEAASDWTYSTATFRPANNNTANRVTVLMGLAGGLTKLDYKMTGHGSAGGQTLAVAIGYDSTTTALGEFPLVGSTGNGYFMSITGNKEHNTGLGFHTYTLLEFGNGSGTQGWYGSSVYSTISGAVTY